MNYTKTLILCAVCSALLILSSNLIAQSVPYSLKLNTDNTYHFTLKHNSDSTKYIKTDYQNPVTAGVLSLAVPGLALGQFYNGQRVKAFVHVGISIGAALIAGLVRLNGSPDLGGFFIGGLVFLVNWTWTVCDAILSATIVNQENKLQRYKRSNK
jgi:TM2 domain-containing membrane protein YozV